MSWRILISMSKIRMIGLSPPSNPGVPAVSFDFPRPEKVAEGFRKESYGKSMSTLVDIFTKVLIVFLVILMGSLLIAIIT